MRRRWWIVAVAGMSFVGAACADRVLAPAPATGRIGAARFDVQSSPQLVVCPTTQAQETTGILGLLGGILPLGATAVNMPFGAVVWPTLFQIVVPASQYMEVDVHAIGLTTFLFQQPVTVTIDYSRCASDAIPAGAHLQVVYIDSQSKTVLEQMGGVDDPLSRTITFTTSHLSGYAIAY